MFTGLVQGVGAVTGRHEVGAELRLTVDVSALAPGAGGGPFRIGDSIALSGVCCTVVELADGRATFHLSRETLERTWLGRAAAGTILNLEGALRAGEPLGGHLVQGHVDGVGEVTGAIDPRGGGELWARVPPELQRYCVEKGSITLDGVSLTIAGRRDGQVRIAVIPHTAEVTTLGRRVVGDPLHVEVDVLAKYVESMLAQRGL
ncbi:MAG: riboflavin synthase [Planctomycetes bacterium]|nr:riboflavin synthase [Planctomycetota bacterium]